MKKYRIGIDARMYRRSSGGIGTYTQNLLAQIAKLDNQNLYYVFLTSEDLKEYNLKVKNFKPIKANYPHYSLKEQVGFRQKLNSYNLDLIHFTNFNHPILYRRKFVVTIHDLTMTLFPAPGRQSAWLQRIFYHSILRNAIKKSKKIITDSKNTQQDILNFYSTDKNKIDIIYLAAEENCQPDSSPQKALKLREKYKIEKPYLLFVSQWRPHKGIINLVEAFEILRKRYKQYNLNLVITGKPNPSFPEIEKRINSSVSRSNIITPGFVDQEDMPALYSHARAFIFPSLYEGFGLNPLEAMACGTPVAASHISSLPEVCGKAALYFDPHDIEDIALKTQTIITNEKLRRDLIQRGFLNNKRFNWHKTAQETVNTYLRVLE